MQQLSRLQLLLDRLVHDYIQIMWNHQFPFAQHYFPVSCYQWVQANQPAYFTAVPSLSAEPELKVEEPLSEQERSSSTEKVAVEQSGPVEARKTRERTTKTQYSKKKKQAKEQFPKKKQKKNRNIPSNICRMFVSFLLQHPSLAEYLGVQNKDSKLIVQNCLRQVQCHFRKDETYIRPQLLQQMCQGKVFGQEESRVFRILFKRFLTTDFRMTISMTKKLRKKEQLAYFRIARKNLDSFLRSS